MTISFFFCIFYLISTKFSCSFYNIYSNKYLYLIKKINLTFVLSCYRSAVAAIAAFIVVVFTAVLVANDFTSFIMI